METLCGDCFVIYRNIESLCCAPVTNIVLQVNYTSVLKEERTCNHSILIGSAVNNFYIVIIIQTLIIGIIKNIKFLGEDEGGEVEVLNLHLIIFIHLKIAFSFYCIYETINVNHFTIRKSKRHAVQVKRIQ